MLSWLFLRGLFACADPVYPTCESAAEPELRSDTPTWHGEVRALVEANCVSCHTDGGLAPVPLDAYGAASAYASAMAAAVADRRMPPWPPADCCRPLLHALALDPNEIAAFQAWAAGGTPEGDEADYVPPESPVTGLPRVDVSLAMSEPYTPAPPAGAIDDTRCFLLDWPEEETRYVTGLAVNPGVATQVHHALLLVAGPATVPQFQATDALDDGPGWSCPGGVVLGYTGWIGGWSPGWTAREMPDGTGQLVEPGSKLILTVHYSVPGGDPAPDTTSVDLMLDDEVDAQLAAITVSDATWLTGGLQIPADEPDVMVSARVTQPLPMTLLGVNLHMHERGKRGSVGIVRHDGTKECLLQIDDWAHEWQGDYLFRDPLEIAAGESLWVECHWDNTASNQRVVNGSPETPRDLGWAEDEEMCVAFVTARAPAP